MNSGPRDSLVSPRFAQVATFMRLPHRTDLRGVDVAIVGVPFDGGVSYRPGTRFGPREVRSQSSLIRQYNSFQATAPFDALNAVDYGDIDAPPVRIEKCFDAVHEGVRGILAANVFPLVVGGDHSITLPVLRAVAERHGPVGLVQFDAHLDTWDDYFGERYAHGTVFRRAIEEGLVEPTRMVQVGIRGPLYSSSDLDYQRTNGITVLDIEYVRERGVAATLEAIRRNATGPVYITFDIDAVDPAFAPATGTPEVGGLTSYEALRLLRGLRGLDAVGFDLVEVSPVYDAPSQITSLLAANLMWEFLCALTACGRFNKQAAVAQVHSDVPVTAMD